jgi:hypothetical protein
MATKTYYGKLDCYSAPLIAAHDPISNEYWKGFCDFMTYLSGNNVVELVAWNSGTSIPAAPFESRGYWDEPNPHGSGSFALWKWLTSSTRNWEWYLYAQCVSGSSGVKFTHTNPITSSGMDVASLFDTPFGFDGFGHYIFTGNVRKDVRTRGILTQAAVCVSGTSSFNPWNGSLRIGDANASLNAGNGPIRWTSGANDRNLSVLPRSNDYAGDDVYQKANGISLGGYNMYGSNYNGQTVTFTNFRYHFISDGDSLLVLTSPTASLQYSISYIGSFDLRNSLTSSGIAGSKLGFCMYTWPHANANAIFLTQIGSTQGLGLLPNFGIPEGGLYFPLLSSGSKHWVPSVMPFNGTAYQPNVLNNTYDEFPILVGVNEALNTGYFGRLPPGMMKLVRSVQTHDTLGDLTRAAFGDQTVGGLRLTAPWYGSLAPGVGTHRTGSTNSWTIDYDP